MTASPTPEAWDEPPAWTDRTVYARTWVVAGDDPQASDGNPGTEQAPLRTIQAALERVQPGERVLVRAGIYREQLAPVRGGTGPAAMIALMAAPGEHVAVRGSRVLAGGWSRPRPWDAGFGADGRMPALSQTVWRRSLDDLTSAERAVVVAPNVPAEHARLMPWMEPVANRPPYGLPRALLFQDGCRLTQLHHAGDVPRVPGSFWIEPDGSGLLLHPRAGRAPAACLIELAVRPHLLCPRQVGLDHVRLSGVVFEHCANAFLRTGAGAVCTLGGGHWLIDGCTIREVGSAGLEFGDYPFERGDPDPRHPGPTWTGSGHVQVRGNHIAACGTAGIRCLGARAARVVGNHISDCGWQDAEYYFECAGIKLLRTHGALVAGNRIERMVGACGIWLDWDNQGSRVTSNLIRDIVSIQGGIFIEGSRAPNSIDRNVIWNVDGPGIFGGDSAHQRYLHNCIGQVTESPFRIFCHTERLLYGQRVTCDGNLMAGNLLVDPPPHRIEGVGNRCLGNLVVRRAPQAAADHAADHELHGTIELAADGILRWELSDDPGRVPWPEDAVDPALVPGTYGPVPLVGTRGAVDLNPPSA